ncbi:MAG TPA: hypothetical protein VIX37_00335, partial [Candidatus Sulfotelmatobacter sp.]
GGPSGWGLSRQRKARPSAPSRSPAPIAHWLKIATLLLTAACLVGLFSTQLDDTDFWWHLKTGQYILEHHSLPVPDPFAVAPPDASASRVRHFNLTHEWLSQVLMYAVYATAGFPGIILARALLLAALCGLGGFLAARLSQNFYAGIAAAVAAASVVIAHCPKTGTVFSFSHFWNRRTEIVRAWQE